MGDSPGCLTVWHYPLGNGQLCYWARGPQQCCGPCRVFLGGVSRPVYEEKGHLWVWVEGVEPSHLLSAFGSGVFLCWTKRAEGEPG